MKTVIFAGGFGTRLSEFTNKIPKPMVEIGGVPIIVHIMDHYAKYGFNDFVIALGYKHEYIKEYFYNFAYLNSDIIVNLKENKVTTLSANKRDWKVTLIDTGLKTSTGTRLKKLEKYLDNERFFLTYGDGVSSLNITNLLNHHINQNKLCTLTSVRPVAKFGELALDGDCVESFEEKPQLVEGWINGGFMVMEPEVFNHIPDSDCMLEREPMNKLIESKNLASFRHTGFWKCMDSKKDKDDLEDIWKENNGWPD